MGRFFSSFGTALCLGANFGRVCAMKTQTTQGGKSKVLRLTLLMIPSVPVSAQVLEYWLYARLPLGFQPYVISRNYPGYPRKLGSIVLCGFSSCTSSHVDDLQLNPTTRLALDTTEALNLIAVLPYGGRRLGYAGVQPSRKTLP